jgi:glutathione S-transferase
VNPQGLVPALETDDGDVLTQSLAIIEWLEEAHPEPPLLPDGAARRARARAFGQVIPATSIRFRTCVCYAT